VSRLFISHSGSNTAEAIAIRDWLAEQGWDDVFLDLDPERGIKAGERWEGALNEAASRCEAVLFLISRHWLTSEWCLEEFNLARHLNKALFGAIIALDVGVDDLPPRLKGTWQVVDLAAGQDHRTFGVILPVTHARAEVTFSQEGLARLRRGLAKAGLDPRFFAWPPPDDPERPPYRGLRPLEGEDAGIFFGRDAPIVELLDRLRGLRRASAPRLLVILGASGSGKSSFLRAGLLPRLARDDRDFLPLPVIRPERAALTGEAGLIGALETALAMHGMARPRAEIRAAAAGGAEQVRPLLQRLADRAFARSLAGESGAKPPAVVLAIDQAEELFLGDGVAEGERLLALARDLAQEDRPATIILFTIRSDSYDRLETAKALDGVAQQTYPLLPMPRGAYQTVIEGPAARLAETPRRLAIEPRLTQRLLEDMEKGGGSDALPLLAFTLEQLYLDYGRAIRELRLADYETFGGIAGAIEAAVERGLAAADADPAIPRDRAARLNLLRRGLIPWLAGIDPDTGAPRRRIARLSEIPFEARPLIQHLVEQRLLATDVNKDTGEATIEPAHEALLRQWGLLDGWLIEDAGLLAVLDGVKRASRDWAANNRSRAWLSHQADRLATTERLLARPDLAANLDPTDRAYIAACRKAETDAKRGRQLLQGVVYAALVAIIVGLVCWINQSYIAGQWRWLTVTGPYAAAQVRPHVLTAEQEQALKPGQSFKECARDCPEMVVVPAGSFMMGAPATEHQAFGYATQIPRYTVTIAKPFAVSKYEVTFADWDACVTGGGCNAYKPNDWGWGHGQQPVINVNWDDAQQYVAWLSQVTGRTYRLLSEAEYEYAARGGTQTAYPWGDDIGKNNANCNGCGSKWDSRHRTAPVGSFAPNQFGLYDMVGNVWARVEDCYSDSYNGAPTDGSARTGGDCYNRVLRGGSWMNDPRFLRSASRDWARSGNRWNTIGFRVARTLLAP
jgi:formylglycine-generating enzyme required for sulfatase activity